MLSETEALKLRGESIALERLARIAKQRLGSAAPADACSERLVLIFLEQQRQRIIELERQLAKKSETLASPASEV